MVLKHYLEIKMKTTLSEALLKELGRHNQINNYIREQEEPPAEEPVDTEPPTPIGGETTPPPPPSDMTLGGATPEAGETTPGAGEPIDIANDPDVEEITGDDETVPDTKTDTTIDSDTDTGTEELDVTELVKSQRDIQQKQDEYISMMTSKLEDLEQKLSQMDNIFQKINNIETNLEKYRPKSPEEKLELRSLDSYPFNQKLTDFFTEKSEDMEKTGKNEYILRPEDVEDVDSRQIRKTFDQGLEN